MFSSTLNARVYMMWEETSIIWDASTAPMKAKSWWAQVLIESYRALSELEEAEVSLVTRIKD